MATTSPDRRGTHNSMSMDISGVLEETERNRKVDRLNQLSHTFEKRNPSHGLGSDRESAMTNGHEQVSHEVLFHISLFISRFFCKAENGQDLSTDSFCVTFSKIKVISTVS